MNHIPEITPYEAKSVTRNKKCKCTERCTEFFRIDGFDVYCKGALEQLAINILNQVNGTNISQGNFSNRHWTTKQVEQLTEFIEKNGVRYGTYRIIGEMIGKPREAVKHKVQELEKKGLLKRKERA